MIGINARNKGFFRLAIKRLGRESAAVDFAAFLHELREALIDEKMSGKRLIAERRKTALEAERDSGTIKQDRRLVSFTQQARSDQSVDNPDRTFKGDGVKGDQSFFAGVGFDVWERLSLRSPRESLRLYAVLFRLLA